MEGIKIKSPERYLLIVLTVLIMLIFVFILALLFFLFQGDSDVTNTLNQFYLILFSILIIILIVLVSTSMAFLIFFTKALGKRFKGKEVMELSVEDIKSMNNDEKNDLLQELNTRRERIEYLIKLAESKYHKRKLDEQSFREIVRDHQKMEMEIEAQMNEIREEINKLKKEK